VPSLLLFLVLLTLTDGLGEEPGWRGFALPRLLIRSTIRPRWAGEAFSVHDSVYALFIIRLREAQQHVQDQAV
jgi:hypothetical protein